MRRLALPVAFVACSSSETSQTVETPFTTSVKQARHHAYDVSRGGVTVGRRRDDDPGACRFRTKEIAGIPTTSVEPTFANGVATFAHSNAREVIAPHGAGAEQQWLFSARPGGELRVDVAVEGDYDGERSGDALFRCRNGSLATYGPATLIDAKGRRTSVARTIHGSTITLSVDAAALAAAEFPVVVDPIVRAEQVIEAPVPLNADRVDMPTSSMLRHLTAGSDSWLIGWEAPSYETHINRLNTDGTLAWPTDLSLKGLQRYGTSYDGTTWTIFADYAPPGSTSSAIYRRRVAASGTWMDSSWEKVIEGHGTTAAWDGTHHVVVGRESRNGARVSPTGAVGPTFTTPPMGGYEVGDLECSNTGDCLLISMGGPIDAVRIKNGVVLDSTPLRIQDPSLSAGGSNAWASWTGSSWVVVYTDPVDHRVLVTRLGTDGVVIGTTTVATDGLHSAISCSADSCRVAYVGAFDGKLYTRRIDFAGVPLDAPTAIGMDYVPTVKCTSSHCLIIDGDVRGIRTTGATILDTTPIQLRWIENVQSGAFTASSGDSALVAWRDLRGDPPPTDTIEARAARFTAGSLVDSPSKLMFRGMVEAAAHDGSSWVTIAQDNAGGRWLRRLDSALNVTSTHALPSLPDEKLTCNAMGCLRAFRTAYWSSDLQVQIIPKAGAPGSTVAVASTGVREYTVGSGPASFLFVYDVGGSNLVFTRVANDGTILDTTPVAIPGSTAKWAAVTFVEDTWIVTWGSEASTYPFRNAIRASRVSAAGIVLDPVPIEVTSGVSSGAPTIAPANDGHSALIAWPGDSSTPGYYGAFVARDGRVLDPVPFMIGGYPSAPMVPAGRGRILMASQIGDGHYVGRITTRIIESGALDGATCTTNTECASRYCVDGHCCNKSCGGSCESCGTGACSAVKSADDADTCTGTKTCSATGDCRLKSGNACSAGTECASGNCVDGVCCSSGCGTCGACNVTPGTCTPRAVGSTLCGPYLCNGTDVACPVTCSDDSSCGADYYCAADKTCVARKAKGSTCAATDCATTGCRVCTTGHCAEGVCCESACDGACASCNATGSIGSCVARTKGTDKGCSPYLCDGSAVTCPTACSATADCVAGSWCDGGKCVPTLADGASCTTAGSCVSGHCVDGVCCDSACAGQCEACDVAGSIGTCSAVAGAPHGSREACGKDPKEPVCGVRSCDGIARSSCEARPGSETSCEAARCVDGREYAARHCAGGVCESVVGRECAPYACGADGRCAMSCTDAAQCAAGKSCIEGRCADAASEPPAVSDAGPAPPIAPEEGGGCGCRTQTRGSPSALPALGGLAALLWRRRRRHAD